MEHKKVNIEDSGLAKDMQTVFDKYGINAHLVVGMDIAKGDRAFSFVSGDGAELVTMLFTLMMDYEEIFLAFNRVMMSICVAAAKKEGVLTNLMPTDPRKKRGDSRPAIMGSAKF
jgi:hypothetical protein